MVDQSPPKKFMKLRRLKWEGRVALRRLRQRSRHGRMLGFGLPRIFGNAMAKSGSHVLAQFLEGLEAVAPLVFVDIHPIRTFDGSGAIRPPRSVLADLKRIRRGDMGWGYLPSDPPYLNWADARKILTFFILRDPRDKIISHIFFATEIHPGHAMKDFYAGISSMEERIDVTIDGVPGLLPDIRSSYESYLGWLDRPRVMTVRFEDFVEDRRPTLGRLLDCLEHHGVPFTSPREDVLELLNEAMSPARSPTFRSGHTGEWQKHFSKRNLEHFNVVAGDLLMRLGYEGG